MVSEKLYRTKIHMIATFLSETIHNHFPKEKAEHVLVMTRPEFGLRNGLKRRFWLKQANETLPAFRAGDGAEDEWVGLSSRDPGLSFRDTGLSFRAPGLSFRDPGLSFRATGLNFKGQARSEKQRPGLNFKGQARKEFRASCGSEKQIPRPKSSRIGIYCGWIHGLSFRDPRLRFRKPGLRASDPGSSIRDPGLNVRAQA